jgi:amino acid transporter
MPALATRKGELALLIGQLAFFNYIGVKTGKNVSNFFTFVKVSFLLFFVIAGLPAWHFRPALRVPFSVPAVSVKSWFEAILLLVYAYGGFEGALFVGGETKNPKRDTPVALLTALATVCLIYTGVQFVTVATLPGAGSSARPLADAAQRFLGSGGSAAIAIAALVSAYGYLSANLLHAPRVTFALAEQGDFPSFFGAVRARFRTPYLSILTDAVLLFVFAPSAIFAGTRPSRLCRVLPCMGLWRWPCPFCAQEKTARRSSSFRPLAFFAGFTLFSPLVLLTQMGRAEFYVVSTTCRIAWLNWIVARR